MKAGVDLGGTKIQAVVTDGDDRVIGSARRETPREGGPDAIVLDLAEAVRRALADAEIEVMGLSGVGVGVPGSIDAERGMVLQVANVPGFDRPFPLGDVLAEELDRPVRIGNDVSLGTEAERRFGAGRGYRSYLGVFWGTGVGGGLVLDGALWHGRGSAGEIGHVCAEPRGRRCACGLEGCVEAYAGRSSLEALAREEAVRRPTALFDIAARRGRDRLTSGVWQRAAEAGDEVALDLLGRAVEALGVAIGSAVSLLDVEAVIVGGGLGERLGAEWLARIERAARRHTFYANPPEYRLVELGDLGGAIGASLIAP